MRCYHYVWCLNPFALCLSVSSVCRHTSVAPPRVLKVELVLLSITMVTMSEEMTWSPSEVGGGSYKFRLTLCP